MATDRAQEVRDRLNPPCPDCGAPGSEQEKITTGRWHCTGCGNNYRGGSGGE